MTISDDKKWIREALSGDPSSFELLIEKYQARLYRYCYRLVANREDAEDIVQETFVKLHRNLKQIDAPERLSSWLYAVAGNAAKNLLRWRSIRFWLPLDEFSATGRSSDSTAADEVESESLGSYLSLLLKQVPLSLRLVFVLRLLEGQSEAATANILGLSANAVRIRLSRAKQRLWDLYKKSLDL